MNVCAIFLQKDYMLHLLSIHVSRVKWVGWNILLLLMIFLKCWICFIMSEFPSNSHDCIHCWNNFLKLPTAKFIMNICLLQIYVKIICCIPTTYLIYKIDLSVCFFTWKLEKWVHELVLYLGCMNNMTWDTIILFSFLFLLKMNNITLYKINFFKKDF